MSTPLPPEDRDLRAARQLDAGDVSGDALLSTLAPFRAQPADVDRETANRIWAGIEAKTKPAAPVRARPAADRQPARGLRLIRSRTFVRALAAAFVAAFVLTVWMLQRSPQDLVAEAGATMLEVASPDGSTIVLRPHSRLTRTDGAGRQYQLEGEAYFAVARDEVNPFSVETATGSIRVLGTEFNVSTWSARTSVFVAEGRVELASGTDAVELTAGEAAWAGPEGLRQDSAVVAEAYLDWRTERLVFDRQPARQVADELAQHLGREIVLPADVATETISGTITLDDTALNQLGRVLGGAFVTGPEGEAVFSR
ncbi:MAG: FecR domain-containing protein [Bacteroidota bacterium]